MQPASRWLDARSSWHAAELLHLAQSGQADLNDRVSGFGIAAEKTAHAASVEPDANDRQVGARTAIHSDLTPSRDVITQPRPIADQPRRKGWHRWTTCVLAALDSIIALNDRGISMPGCSCGPGPALWHLNSRSECRWVTGHGVVENETTRMTDLGQPVSSALLHSWPIKESILLTTFQITRDCSQMYLSSPEKRKQIHTENHNHTTPNLAHEQGLDSILK